MREEEQLEANKRMQNSILEIMVRLEALEDMDTVNLTRQIKERDDRINDLLATIVKLSDVVAWSTENARKNQPYREMF